MPTYYRVPEFKYLLEESIESFLRQGYANKELIILNDCPGQKLIFSHPKIIVINTNRRIQTLGEKFNTMVALSSGELICPWEDDDISLPHRLSLSQEHITHCEYWRPDQSWVWSGNKYRYNTSMKRNFHFQSIYTRKAFNKIKGYQHNSYLLGEQFENDLDKHNIKYSIQDLDISDWFYIYRKQHKSYHTSDNKNMYKSLGKIAIQEGEFPLSPHWQKEYKYEIKKAAKKANSSNQVVRRFNA